jgi:hypothetical protein
VHDWYDEYDNHLAAAIRDNLDRQTLMQENQANGYDLCRQGGDYEKCENRQMAEFVEPGTTSRPWPATML